MILRLVTAPAMEPVTLTDVEGQHRLTDLSAEADTIERYITSLRELAETVTRRALITQTWELVLNKFPGGRTPIELPLPPLQTIDSVKYFDTSGIEQTLDVSQYRVIKSTFQPGFVLPAFDCDWPEARHDLATVTIRFTCGYGPTAEDSGDNVPASIKQWILLNISTLYENREMLTIGIKGEEILDFAKMLGNALINDYRIVKWSDWSDCE